MCSPLLSFFKSGRLSESWHDWLINVLVRRPAVHFHVWSHFLLTFLGLRANGHASTGCPVPPSLCRVASESIGQPMTDLFVEGIMWISEFERCTQQVEVHPGHLEESCEARSWTKSCSSFSADIRYGTYFHKACSVGCFHQDKFSAALKGFL